MDIEDAARALVEQEMQTKLQTIQAAAEAWVAVEKSREELAQREAEYGRLYQEALAAGWSPQKLRKVGLKAMKEAPKRRSTPRAKKGGEDATGSLSAPDQTSPAPQTGQVAGEVIDPAQSAA